MFPQIAKRKRKEIVFEEGVTRQAEEALRDLDLRTKTALKRIPPHILQDFSKVCRVKSIPEFYAHYFITSTQRTDPLRLSEVYAEEIERLLTNSSHFHRINQALRQREELIEGLRNSLAVVEGFLLMNQNKPVPLQMKAEIDAMVSGCASLEELKELQRKKTEAMAMDIIRVRTNTTQLVELVQEWRKDLNELMGEGGRRATAVYPHQGINCLLMPLYDLLFLRASSLKGELSFGKDEHDPFLERITKSKRGSQIQQYLLDYLKADTSDYTPYAKAIIEELPSDEAEKQKEREAEIERQKEERAREQKEERAREQKEERAREQKEERAREQKLKEEKLKSLRQEKDKNVRIRHYSSLKSLKQTQLEKARTLTIKTSKGERTDRKIINIDKLLSGSKKKEKEKQPLSENESKILVVYKKGKRVSMEHSGVVQREQLIQEKRLWEKTIKQEKYEKEKIRKQLRQTEKRALQENKQFELKLKKYEEEVHNLKSRIEQSKKQSRVLSSKATPTQSKNKKQIVINAYRSQRSGRDNLGTQALESKLQEESKNKRHMEKQIKQLAQEKQKLQRLIGRETVRASKEVETSRRQLEKYEEVIAKLKNETEESRRIIQELELSKISEENKQADAIRISKVKERAEQLKRAAQNRLQEKEKAAKAIQQKKESLQRSPSKKRHSLASSRTNQNTSQVRSSHPEVQTLKSRLQQQSRAKKNLESQIRELGQQKAKLERLIEKESFKSAKDQQRNSRKIQKYQQTINRLKKQSEDSRKIIGQIQSNKITEELKESERSKVETVKKKEEDLKRKIKEKIEQRQRRKEIQKSRVQGLQRSRGEERRRQQNVSLGDDVEIIKTKQTIEIVFEPRRNRAHRSKELLQSQSKLVRLEKERELLEKKLEMSVLDKKERTQQQRALAKAQTEKAQARAQEVSERLRGQVEKQRAKNGKLEENLKKMRTSISNEYEMRLNQEKVRFQREREELLRTIQRQREEKHNKDKVLEQQMSFLKEMEKKEHELFDLLQSEKREKARKQHILAQEIEEKEELINIMQFEEIKKRIEREVRREIEENTSQEEDDFSHQQRKAELEQEIEQLRLEKEQELEEMNGQNEKLKDLIAQLKVEENQLLEAMKENIEMESESEGEDQPPPETPQDHALEPVTNQPLTKKATLEELQQRNQQLEKELHSKTLMQFKNEEKQKQKYSRIANSEDFHQKQKIENLVQFYLKSPADYPGDMQVEKEKETKLKETEKKEIVDGTTEKARMIQQFQNDLFSLRELPDFVPTLKNDSINNHLLNLREVYQDYEADSLRRELFPPLEEEVYGEGLSEDDPEPPMNTLMDGVRAHLHKYPTKKDDKGKKNFLAINRVRLAVLEDTRKEKQRQIIEEQSKKHIQRELFEKRRKQREENFIREREKENQLKEQKRQEAYRHEKTRLERERLSNEKRQQERSKQRKKREQQKRQNSGQKINPSKQLQKQRKKSKRKGKGKRQASSSDSDNSRSDNEANKKGKHPNKEPSMLPIKEQHPEQSLEQQQAELAEQVEEYEEELQKRQHEVLKTDIKQMQEEVRAYIKEQQQFTVYQQFINQAQLLPRIQEILDLSSMEIRSLNSNQNILEDIQLYSVLTILVAKNSKGLEIGLGVFHKELQSGQYVCDYLLAHNMENFLNLAFNFSRFLFQNDPYANKNEFIFDIKSVTDSQTLRHFLQFQKKCRRLGEVYIKAQSQTQRKYVLRRTLFQAVGDKHQSENGGAYFNLKLSLCGNILTQINAGFKNKSNFNYSSFNLITAYYLSRKQKKLQHFREKAETELLYREMLVTALLFQKKELEIKNFTLVEHGGKDVGSLVRLKDRFDLADVDELDEMSMLLSQKLPQSIKRCTLEVGLEQVNYLLISPEEAVTSIQSSNSSETGYFLSVVPKYKLMVVEAEEYLTMSGKNPDLTAFFYIKHFIKNIVDVKKEKYDRVYLPEIQLKNEFHFSDLSKRLGETVFLSESVEIGWKSNFPNSVLYTPRHQDLVIQKPFIVALLSGPVERAVEGSPIFVQLIV